MELEGVDQSDSSMETVGEWFGKDQGKGSRNGLGLLASGTDFNALIAMFVEGVKSGICSFYATLYTQCRFNGVHG